MMVHRHTAFALHLILWIVVSTFLLLFGHMVIIAFALPLIIVDLWLALCLGFMLRLPVQRQNNQPPVNWKWEEYMIMDYPVRWLSKTIDVDKPLAILIHGWNSRAANMIGRGDLYEKLGYNVILFEMRAHGGNKRVSNWAALQVCYDLEQVLQLFQKRGWLSKGFIVHGHSLGGFVAQRVLRDEMETSKHALGTILESPVTSYEYINNQTCEYLKIPKFLRKYMMNRLIKYYNKLNPSVFQAQNLDHLSTPEWGLPNCPTLLVQAKHDSTLGTKHSGLLIDVHSNLDTDFTFHIVENLKHAYESKNDVRDSLIRNWMEEKSLFFR